MKAVAPLTVTFDTNAYSPVARPQVLKIFTTGWQWTAAQRLSKKRRIAWLYLQWCVRRARIKAGIPEAAFTAEVLPNVDRINLLLGIGTPPATDPPLIPAGRRELIGSAFQMGFRCLHAPRIAYGEIIKVERDRWASDDLHDAGTRQQRQSDFLRHFQDFSYQALKSFGIQLLTLHSLTPLPSNWRNGLVAEEQTPRMHRRSYF